jgi:hypothetical protein
MKRPNCVIALGWLALTYYNVGLRSSIFARLGIWDLFDRPERFHVLRI